MAGRVRKLLTLNRVAAADELSLEEADLAHHLAIEVALADPALRLDGAQVDVDAEHALELLAHAGGRLATHDGAAGLDQGADLADELGAGGAQLLHGGDLRLDRLDVVLGALRHLAELRLRLAAEGKRQLRDRRAR